MSREDIIASAFLALLFLGGTFLAHRRLRRRAAYRKRGFAARAVVLLAVVVFGFVVVTWLPVLVLRFVPPVGSAFMALRVVPCRGVAYDWVAWDEISPAVPIAFVAAEDQLFPDHHGFDVEAIQRVLEERGDGKARRGASTISQQTAKNLFLWPGRSWVRKGLEAWWTTLLELTWPKRRILEVYVNVAQLDACTFGVGAASRQFFSRPAADLGPSHAALLAAVLPNPSRFQVDAPSGYVRGRQSWIERQVRQLGGPGYLDDL